MRGHGMGRHIAKSARHGTGATTVLWIKVSRDKYELIEAVADTAPQLARMCGVTPLAVYHGVSKVRLHAQKWTAYRRIEVPVEDDE